MKLHFTSDYHSEADGLTERTNQTLKQYLHVYYTYQQDNWFDLLPLAEFAFNNTPSATTGVSPFFANKGYHPNISINPKHSLASACAHELAVNLLELHEYLKENIWLAQQRYQGPADNCRTPPPDFKIGNRVFVKAKFFKTTRPSPKLSEKYLGPFNHRLTKFSVIHSLSPDNNVQHPSHLSRLHAQASHAEQNPEPDSVSLSTCQN
jgi:hypothetical protein